MFQGTNFISYSEIHSLWSISHGENFLFTGRKERDSIVKDIIIFSSRHGIVMIGIVFFEPSFALDNNDVCSLRRKSKDTT